MDEYAGRVLAGRYRLPRPPSDGYELAETPAFDTYSGQEVMARQVPLPEVVQAELVGAGAPGRGPSAGSDGPARRALEAAVAAARIPDHPRLVQVFDVFLDDAGPGSGSLWIVSELVRARPLAALLGADRLSPYRAAEIAADVLTAARVLHAHGWTHRNITTRTVLVCDDGRAMLGGLAESAAEEALCGFDPVPEEVLAGGLPADGTAADGTAADGHTEGASVASRGGPDSAAAHERARQARIGVVGAVTERWAPEQAGPMHDSWQLAPPVGPAADLWALGALLFRSVQGHPPFPEHSAAELVQAVCSEPPAYAEECGPLRPVVESLLRADPEERPEPEELSGWLRSLIRSAPEPDLGTAPVSVPTDPRRLPEVRRRGELVRRRRLFSRGAGAAQQGRTGRDRERHDRPAAASVSAAAPPPAAVPDLGVVGAVPSGQGRHGGRHRNSGRNPKSLGLVLVSLVFLLVAGALLAAVLFLPGNGGTGAEAGPSVSQSSVPAAVEPPAGQAPSGEEEQDGRESSGGGTPTRTADAGPGAADGFASHKDPEGFAVAVPDGWRRSEAGGGRVRFADGEYEMLVVPGRDSAASFGEDPLAYQVDKEKELAAFRSSSWSSASGLRRLTVAGDPAATGTFTWHASGRGELYVRNLAVLSGGRYHVVLVTGPSDRGAEVDRFFDEAVRTFRPSA
ncbi:protein tyrosine kinase [Streptomyces sp. NPDC059637]|uniref:protein tyrosine kinase n=1 Tax=Streptomyces sp. NPDC059637 TaxID=3347752 RepID=UPI0036800140